MLQLDVPGGTYVGGTDETTYSASNPFTVRALIDPSLVGWNLYLSAAIVPKQGANSTNFGGFAIDGHQYDATHDMQFGGPPVDDPVKNLQTHGIYETWYAELQFSALGSGTLPAYNVQDDSPAPGLLHYVDFAVDISGLAGYTDNGDGTYTSTLHGVHFDLYTYDNTGNKIDYFAPFSHDAQSGGHGITILPPLPSPPPTDIPDGGTTLVLLGSAMTAVEALRRKQRAKNR